MPLVSVVLPTYNAAEFVIDTIYSVLNQSFRDLELIVIDDCSTDATVSIIRKICDTDSRIALIELDKNMGGPACPRNIGVSRATGKWICFVDADDLWHSLKISRQLGVLNGLGASFCCTDITVFKDKSEFPDSGMGPEQSNYQKYTFRQQCSKNRICNSSVMVASDLLRRFPFFESPSYHAVEDMQCWLQLLESIDECVVINAPLVGYRISANQISKNKLIMAKKFFMVLKKYRMKSGEDLGAKIYIFFIQYCWFSLWPFVRRIFKL